MEIIDTLAIAKGNLLDAMEIGGMDCPCCGRYAREYRYKISRAQMASFRWIVHASLNGLHFIDVQATAPKWLLRSNSHGKLAHWRLLETKLADDPAVHCGGWWRPTRFGMQFYYGNVGIREYALVFNNNRHRFSGGTVYFYDVHSRFHYGKLMERHATEGSR